MSAELTLYRDLLADIKVRVRTAQRKAALSANAEMIFMYWDIGSMIAARQKREGWGAGVIPRLAVDLKNELPEQKGFSETNLKRMVQFSQEYPGLGAIGAQAAPQLHAPDTMLEKGARPAPLFAPSVIVQPPAAQLPLPPHIIRQQFLFYSVGTKVSGISKSNIPKLTLSFPSVPEQTAIAEVLTEMDGELAVLEQRREKTHALQQAMMHSLLTGRTRLL